MLSAPATWSHSKSPAHATGARALCRSPTASSHAPPPEASSPAPSCSVGVGFPSRPPHRPGGPCKRGPGLTSHAAPGPGACARLSSVPHAPLSRPRGAEPPSERGGLGAPHSPLWPQASESPALSSSGQGWHGGPGGGRGTPMRPPSRVFLKRSSYLHSEDPVLWLPPTAPTSQGYRPPKHPPEPAELNKSGHIPTTGS